MKKILIVVNNIIEGGLTHVLLDLIGVLSARCDVTVLTVYDFSDVYKTDINSKAHLYTLDKYRKVITVPILRSMYSRLMDNRKYQHFMYNCFISRYKFNYEVAFAEDWSVKLVAASKSCTHKLVWIHTDFLCNGTFDSHTDIEIYKSLLKCFEMNIFVTEALRVKFSKLLSLTNTISIHNTINVSKLKENLDSPPFAFLDPKVVNFVYIGRLSKEKGVDRLLNSCSKLTKEQSFKWHLYLIGDGEQRMLLETLTEKFGLVDNVTFCGSQKIPHSILRNAAALLLPSRYEGFGLVLLEAMALSVPTIATATVGAREVLDNGKYGIMLANEDNAFDTILKQVIERPSMLDKYRRLGPLRAEDYSMTKFAQKVYKIVE